MRCADGGVSAVRAPEAVRRTKVPGWVVAHILGIFALREPVLVVPLMIVVPLVIGLI
jgi:hypothetical protein